MQLSPHSLHGAQLPRNPAPYQPASCLQQLDRSRPTNKGWSTNLLSVIAARQSSRGPRRSMPCCTTTCAHPTATMPQVLLAPCRTPSHRTLADCLYVSTLLLRWPAIIRQAEHAQIQAEATTDAKFCMRAQTAACAWRCSRCRRWRPAACTTMLVRLPFVFRFPTTIRPSSPQVTAAADTLMLKIHISYLPADTYLLGDPAGGGFHRYSVDEFWHIPHFEKVIAWRGNAPQHLRTPVQANETARSLPCMCGLQLICSVDKQSLQCHRLQMLYDNPQLANSYLAAFQVRGAR